MARVENGSRDTVQDSPRTKRKRREIVFTTPATDLGAKQARRAWDTAGREVYKVVYPEGWDPATKTFIAEPQKVAEAYEGLPPMMQPAARSAGKGKAKQRIRFPSGAPPVSNVWARLQASKQAVSDGSSAAVPATQQPKQRHQWRAQPATPLSPEVAHAVGGGKLVNGVALTDALNMSLDSLMAKPAKTKPAKGRSGALGN